MLIIPDRNVLRLYDFFFTAQNVLPVKIGYYNGASERRVILLTRQPSCRFDRRICLVHFLLICILFVRKKYSNKIRSLFRNNTTVINLYQLFYIRSKIKIVSTIYARFAIFVNLYDNEDLYSSENCHFQFHFEIIWNEPITFLH